VWKAVEREKVFAMTITGDAMARPLVSALESGSYDLSNLVFFSSTGAILTGSVRDRLQELMPAVGILDNFGSTESGFTAQGASGSSPEAGLRFKAGTADLQVLDDDFNIVQPGSGVIGQVAKTGFIAHGYYNDPDKTARTFVEVEGKRWLLTGDIASVDEDGTIAVYGRGSQAINTGGEKVFPEEIEAVLKGHPGVFDAVVTGVPDEQYGFKVAAVVQPFPGQAVPETADLDEHCKKKIANYKRPRLYTFVEEIQRSPAGKADYPWAKKLFAENS
jgi:3-oxocholest-4-en-26-oate---CoA ligase